MLAASERSYLKGIMSTVTEHMHTHAAHTLAHVHTCHTHIYVRWLIFKTSVRKYILCELAFSIPQMK